ncbi:peptide/nickel transport system ATP-binding protein [Vreelandella songnenensis]|uniref:Peptide/nickel transport system ATP-binding protein n=1 Tax=Vreelandella songnenensis TaxID=1176243 RepID=A0A2T0UYW4_9GAMM|nr:dipeptide/oligopeptide/nickel ABC transporter ATP-binding protein [Halomonas songnenensis]PRY63028.1 peptide/nickel transport system ATP-binding protein [Halomonas songnenensis]
MPSLLTLKRSDAFLSARGLNKSVTLPREVFWRAGERKPVMRNIDLTLYPGERVGLVGLSGSGKTTLLRSLLAIEAPDSGSITCQDKTVCPASTAKLRWYRQAVQYIPQDPASSLDPRMSVRALVAEPLIRLRVECNPDERAVEALEQVGLGTAFLKRKPHELSGGQAQRVAIARAIATRPRFLLADEPLSGLDLPVRTQVINVLRTLCEDRGTGILMVSHDLSVVTRLCQRTLVMDDGRIVEDRPTAELWRAPGHYITRDLISAVSQLPTCVYPSCNAAEVDALL